MELRPFALILLAAACSSSSSAPPAAAPDSGADDAGVAAPDATTADAPGSDTTCGPPPYVNVGLVVKSASSTGADGSPVEGAKLTTSLCPGITRVSAADGTINAQITKSA